MTESKKMTKRDTIQMKAIVPRLPGLMALTFLSLTTCLWTFWGISELYYEGWGLPFPEPLAYLVPAGLCLALRTYPKIRATPLPPGDKSPGYQRKVRLSGLNSQVLAVFRRLWMNSPDIHVRAEWRKIFFG